MSELQSHTIAARIAGFARRSPEHAAIVTQRRTLSYAQVLDLAAGVALRMREHGVGSASTLHLRIADHGLIMSALIAASALAARVVSPLLAGAHRAAGHITHEVGTAEADCPDCERILLEDNFDPAIYSKHQKAQIWRAGLARPGSGLLVLADHARPDWAAARVLDHRSLIADAGALMAVHGGAADRMASMYPHGSGPSVFLALTALLHGKTSVEKRDLAVWRTSGVTLVACDLGHVPHLHAQPAVGQKIRCLVVSGGRVSEDALAALADRFDSVEQSAIAKPGEANPAPSTPLGELEMVEALLRSIQGINDAVVFSSPKASVSGNVAFLLFEDGVNKLQLFELAKKFCREQLGEAFVPVRMWPVEAIPKTKAGAPDRQACQDRILAAASGMDTG